MNCYNCANQYENICPTCHKCQFHCGCTENKLKKQMNIDKYNNKFHKIEELMTKQYATIKNSNYKRDF